MKNHRFPWLRNRTTDNRKCEKARNIKEKRTIEMFSTVSKQLVALHSSANDNLQLKNAKKPGNIPFSGLFLCLKSPDSEGLEKVDRTFFTGSCGGIWLCQKMSI